MSWGLSTTSGRVGCFFWLGLVSCRMGRCYKSMIPTVVIRGHGSSATTWTTFRNVAELFGIQLKETSLWGWILLLCCEATLLYGSRCASYTFWGEYKGSTWQVYRSCCPQPSVARDAAVDVLFLFHNVSGLCGCRCEIQQFLSKSCYPVLVGVNMGLDICH